LPKWYKDSGYQGDIKESLAADATAFNAVYTQQKTVALLKSNIKQGVALAAHNAHFELPGAEQVNNELKKALAAKDFDAVDNAVNNAVTTFLDESKKTNTTITTEWVNKDLKNWYANHAYEGKAKVDADATAAIERKNVQTHFEADINRVLAVAAQNAIANKEGARADQKELLKGIADGDNAVIVKKSEAILAQAPDLMIEKINNLATWHKKYNDNLPDAHKHLMDDANRMVALAALDEAQGNDGGKARNEALKKSIADNDVAAYDRASTAILEEFPNLNVKWIDDTLDKWYSGWYQENHDKDDIASLKADATAFKTIYASTQSRAKIDALLKSDIKLIVALSAYSVHHKLPGAEETDNELKKALETKGFDAVSKAIAALLEDRKDNAFITADWVNRDLTKWYSTHTYEGKEKVDTDAAGFNHKQKVQAHFSGDINRVLAIVQPRMP
jgi:hypothetical protein